MLEVTRKTAAVSLIAGLALGPLCAFVLSRFAITVQTATSFQVFRLTFWQGLLAMLLMFGIGILAGALANYAAGMVERI